MYKEALEHWKAIFAIRGERKVVEALDRGYAEVGYERAMALAAETLAAQSRTATAYTSSFVIAALYADAGNKDQTLDWLEKAYMARDSSTTFVHVIPNFAFLRSEPRFQDLLRRMNLPIE